ncbi:hypothetical protein SUGI_0585800 [Cryptomeria japonica]|nr:hypothetical protein SUGI_0585800 [Cryptomeria japonica]
MALRFSLSTWSRREKNVLFIFRLAYFGTSAISLKTGLKLISKQANQPQSKERQSKDVLCDLLMMDRQHILPDAYTYASVLQQCIDAKAVAEGKRLHAHMVQSGFDPDVYLATKLVVMYSRIRSTWSGRGGAFWSKENRSCSE